MIGKKKTTKHNTSITNVIYLSPFNSTFYLVYAYITGWQRIHFNVRVRFACNKFFSHFPLFFSLLFPSPPLPLYCVYIKAMSVELDVENTIYFERKLKAFFLFYS
jgi:hypothetical protein